MQTSILKNLEEKSEDRDKPSLQKKALPFLAASLEHLLLRS